MIKKYMVVGLMLLFVGAILNPAIAQNREEPSEVKTISFQENDRSSLLHPIEGFALNSAILLSWDANETEEPLEPGGLPRNINVTVTYQTFASSVIGRLILLYCRLTHQSVTVHLGIRDIPSWCTASLSASELPYLITGNESSKLVTLTAALDENAPAYKLCQIPLQASIDTLHGPFGFLPLVNNYTITYDIYVFAAYRPNITVIPENDTLAVIPNESSYLRIFITNTGNARTVVLGSIVHTPPGHWIAMMTNQIVLEVNDTGVAYLFVVPPVNFNGTDTIILSFTPYKADDYSQQGEPVYLLITVTYEPP